MPPGVPFDLAIFVQSARCFASHACDPYAFRTNMNPPHFHLLLAPLIQLRDEQIVRAWIVLSVASGVAAAYRIVSAIHARWSPAVAVATVGALAVLGVAKPRLIADNIGLLLLWPFVEAWIAARTRSWLATGAWLGLLVAVKPFFVLFLAAFALMKHWRAVAVASLTAAAIIAIGLMWYGAGAYRDWITNGLGNVTITGHFYDGALLSFLVRLLSRTEYYQPMTLAPPTVVAAIWTLGVVAIGMVTLLAGRDAKDEDARWLMLMAAALLISPKGWLYYGWLLIPPVTARFMLQPSTRSLIAAISVGCALLLPASWPMAGQPNPWLTLTWGSFYFWIWMSLWWLARSSVSGARRETSPDGLAPGA
jgi:alpha-1,2-mannosyltransferase